jgi:hypothetical protein
MRPAWQITDDGLEVWVGSEKTATIPCSDLPHLLADLAASLRYRKQEIGSDGKI